MRWVLLLAVGCYHANGFAPCEASCTADDPTCPAGQECGADLLCHGLGASCTIDAPNAIVVDSPTDATPDSPYPCFAVGLAPEFNPVCMDPTTIQDSYTFSGSLFDTDMPEVCMDWPQRTGQEPDVCLVIAKTITVAAGSHVSAHGKRALAIVATQKLTVEAIATLDAGSTSALSGPGFGQGIDPCPALAIGSDGTGSCSGGGAGGSFGGAGGGGGISGGNSGGVPKAKLPLPTFLRGGCGGGDGVIPSSGLPTGDGRKGGGAVYLVAGTTIEISGTVTAGGAGGYYASSASSGGPGGGGSGGMIVLEAPHIVTLGAGGIYANGGGGGGGNGVQVAQFGGPGKNSLDSTVATGGPPYNGSSGRGGDGSSGGDGQVGVGAAGACGGGGGGGAGYIFVYTNDTPPQTLSPVPYVKPLP